MYYTDVHVGTFIIIIMYMYVHATNAVVTEHHSTFSYLEYGQAFTLQQTIILMLLPCTCICILTIIGALAGFGFDLVKRRVCT